MRNPLPRSPLLALALAAASGCGRGPMPLAAEPAAPAPPTAGAAFDPARSGSVAGRVTWAGAVPDVAQFRFPRMQANGRFAWVEYPNPNAPAIDRDTKAVAGVVVSLRGVEPSAARPWDHPPVRVELADSQIRVRQGDGAARRVGFVRRGDGVEMVSRESAFRSLRARGTSFFTLPFPDPDRPLTRVLDRPGRVTLSSPDRNHWAAADLFVSDHPYLTLTAADGTFRFDAVPAGPVEVVAWLANWAVAKEERDPESGFVFRTTYAPPMEAATPVTVETGRNRDLELRLFVGAFPK